MQAGGPVKRWALTKQAPHPWPFSHGMVVEGPLRLVFLAGQVAFDRHGPDRQLVGRGDPAAQTRQAIENVRNLVRQAGGDLGDVVEMTVYATDAGLMEAAGRVAQEYFGEPPPAQSFVVVKALARPELLLEIRAIAAIPPKPAASRRAAVPRRAEGRPAGRAAPRRARR
ncbi:MAG: enamine deaminase RidA [Candidatus Rokuibacteriota bacterium]|nr:MAG: enamine deaminase RidA [Candidatus Rokubacteria bacterium]